MNNRTITIGAVVAIAILGVWWMFVFSPIRSDSSKAQKDVDAAQAETRTLETRVKELEDLEKRAPQIQSDLDRMHKLVPEDADLASFVDQANKLAADAGVKWMSVAPVAPDGTTSTGEIQLTMQLDGGYFQVLDYLNRLEHMPRLVVIDQIQVNANNSAGGTGSAAQELSVSLTARMFKNSGADAATVPGTATSPAGAAAVAGSATTPTSVAGGGGVSAEQGN